MIAGKALRILVLLACALMAAGAMGQQEKKEQSDQPLTNAGIVKLIKARLGEDTIIAMVNTRPGKYSLGADDIVALKKAGVSEKIITAMLNKPAGKAGSSTTPANSPSRGRAQTTTSRHLLSVVG